MFDVDGDKLPDESIKTNGSIKPDGRVKTAVAFVKTLLFGKAYSTASLIILYALFLAVFHNMAFWSFLCDVHGLESWGDYGFFVAVFFLITAFFCLVIGLLPVNAFGKTVMTAILLLSALAAYFMAQYGTMVDGKMVQNVFETDIKEVYDLLTLKMLVYFLMLGLLPAMVIWTMTLRKSLSVWMALKCRFIFLSAALTVILVMVLAGYSSIAPFVRNHKEVRYYLLPNNFIKGLVDYARESAGAELSRSNGLKVIAGDARKGKSWKNRSRRTLFVLVVGETARANNFGLYGYTKNTTPNLSAMTDIVRLDHVTSCGTDTAVSLPCLMSNLGRSGYKLKEARTRENLLDVVSRSGIRVLWLDNQSGCKQVCSRVEYLNTSAMSHPDFCKEGECHDGILVEEVRKYIAQGTLVPDTLAQDSSAQNSLAQDTLLILHQMGSHGPAYYKRYPAGREKFTPACHNAQMDSCSKEEIVNAYDNTILYTDHVLKQLLDILRQASATLDTGLFYVSDHGESLGELGLYLHGAPFMLAPDVQTHVPAVVWLSPKLQQERQLKMDCLSANGKKALSHDNIFHSILGVLDIETVAYKPEKDIFSCQLEG